MKCPECQADNPLEALFYMKCGAKLERKCSHCGTEFPEDAIFCMKCGNKLVPQAGPIIDGSQEEITPEAERRQLTVMFCDLVDSTPLTDKFHLPCFLRLGFIVRPYGYHRTRGRLPSGPGVLFPRPCVCPYYEAKA